LLKISVFILKEEPLKDFRGRTKRSDSPLKRMDCKAVKVDTRRQKSTVNREAKFRGVVTVLEASGLNLRTI
jgi:hypothetical protein